MYRHIKENVSSFVNFGVNTFWPQEESMFLNVGPSMEPKRKRDIKRWYQTKTLILRKWFLVIYVFIHHMNLQNSGNHYWRCGYYSDVILIWMDEVERPNIYTKLDLSHVWINHVLDQTRETRIMKTTTEIFMGRKMWEKWVLSLYNLDNNVSMFCVLSTNLWKVARFLNWCAI